MVKVHSKSVLENCQLNIEMHRIHGQTKSAHGIMQCFPTCGPDFVRGSTGSHFHLPPLKYIWYIFCGGIVIDIQFLWYQIQHISHFTEGWCRNWPSALDMKTSTRNLYYKGTAEHLPSLQGVHDMKMFGKHEYYIFVRLSTRVFSYCSIKYTGSFSFKR